MYNKRMLLVVRNVEESFAVQLYFPLAFAKAARIGECAACIQLHGASVRQSDERKHTCDGAQLHHCRFAFLLAGQPVQEHSGGQYYRDKQGCSHVARKHQCFFVPGCGNPGLRLFQGSLCVEALWGPGSVGGKADVVNLLGVQPVFLGLTQPGGQGVYLVCR